MNRLGVSALVGALAAALALSPAAFAGGLFVPGAGPQPQARAGAFVAKADDPSALLHNVAGFAKLHGTVVSLGVNLVDYSLAYRRAGTYEPTGNDLPYEGVDYPVVENQARPRVGIGRLQAIPLIALSTDLGMPELPVRFGAGLFVPQGYPTRSFPLEHDVGVGTPAPGPQRYDIIEQNATTILPSVAVAWSALPGLDVGARLSAGRAEISGRKAVWAIRNYEEYVERDAVYTFSGSAPFIYGFGAGALYRIGSSFELGAAYSSAINVKVEGEGYSVVGNDVFGDIETVPVPDEYARCAPGGEVGAIKTCMNFDMPQTATIGARWILRDGTGAERADVELDVAWENWSAASDNTLVSDGQNSQTESPLNETINRHGFRDVWSVRLGGAYAVPLGGAHRLIVRAGAAHDTAAAPDSWTRVDIDGKRRTTLTGGLALEGARYRIDLGGGVSLQPDVTVEQCAPPHGPTVQNPGCSGEGDTPVRDRTAPDPIQPTQGPFNQVESPFNAGTYESGYVLFSLGATYWF